MENRRYEENDAQVLGMSVDSAATQKAFAASIGGLPYPLLADFHPKGEVSSLLGIYNDERGTTRRAVIIIDKEGIIRFKQVFDRGLPDPKEILEELLKL
ncbi:MAG: redoxin domain-containing protein [SAR202 cluster bacterium]|nr:redoxin domain-containing protein [SAR202 cluster bacterium]